MFFHPKLEDIQYSAYLTIEIRKKNFLRIAFIYDVNTENLAMPYKIYKNKYLFKANTSAKTKTKFKS